MSGKYSSVHYNEYLQLSKVLDAQHLRSEELGNPAHDEMLFITTHQVYEIWFKQIIHEIKYVANKMSQDIFADSDIGDVIAKLERIGKIQKLMIEQVQIMETMTPLDFLDFRNYLIPASGFQSFQFRVAELMLGLAVNKRMTYNQTVYKSVFDEEKQKTLSELENSKSLYDLLENWLERTPFLEIEGFNFKEKYIEAVKKMGERDKDAINATEYIGDEDKALRVRMLQDTETYIMNTMDEEKYNALRENGEMRLSHKATLAALLIHLYRDVPALRLPYNLLISIVEIDELFTMFRFRHAQMVLRMLGKKMGTGGSSGYDYLMKTVEHHRIFGDLHKISTLLIPRSELPELPAELTQKLNFAYNQK